LAQAPALIPANCPFIELPSVDSTNNYARQLLKAGEPPTRQPVAWHGTGIFAHEQVAGKGQRGKTWVSEKGVNIALSIMVHPSSIALNNAFALSACAALAGYRFFSKYAGDDIRIKWPNDIYWQDRKAGGILIETGVGERRMENRLQEDASQETESYFKWAVVGMGFNINQTAFDPALPNPVSLKQITGKTFEPPVLAEELHQIFCDTYNELISSDFNTAYHLYNHLLYKKGKTVKFKKDNRVFEAVIKEVNTAGQLVVAHNVEECFDFGGVEWVVN
jgi:BirA family transcriptional regulator, biotin operon repressor / biotin---[acetyl-CoA-carboxylase] ligase